MLLAFPAGFAIAYFAGDELAAGRKWFVILAVLSIALGMLLFAIKSYEISLTLLFMSIVSFISFYKSRSKKENDKKISQVIKGKN